MSQTILSFQNASKHERPTSFLFSEKLRKRNERFYKMNRRGFLIAVVLVWATIQESASFTAGIGNLKLGKKRAFSQNWKNEVLKVGDDLLQL